MSKYTIQLRWIAETEAGLKESAGYSSLDQILQNSHKRIFDFDYPFPSVPDGITPPVVYTKEQFEMYFIEHFYMREIGVETYPYWKIRLRAKMHEIMPMYSSLLYNEWSMYKANPLYSVYLEQSGSITDTGTKTTKETTDEDNKIDTTFTEDTTNTSNSTLNRDLTNEQDTGIDSSNTKWDIYSDTPQGALTNVENETYLTNARKTTDSGNETQHTEGSGTDNQTFTGTDKIDRDTTDSRTEDKTKVRDENVNDTNKRELDTLQRGWKGRSPFEVYAEFAKNIMNIYRMIFDECEDLFMQVW